MKIFVILLAVLVATHAMPSDTYNIDFEKFNVQEMVENDSLLKNYINCFLKKGPCTPEGKEFRELIHDALETECAKCTPKHKELIRIVIKAFQTKTPDYWEELVKQEDPNNKYKEIFDKFYNATD